MDRSKCLTKKKIASRETTDVVGLGGGLDICDDTDGSDDVESEEIV